MAKKVRKKDAYSGYCTAPRCNKFVDPGHGIQVFDKDKGTEDRYCIPCYEKQCKKEADEWEKKRAQQQSSQSTQSS